MLATDTDNETNRYARCVDISKRVRWDIDEERDQAVTDLIDLVVAVDGILQAQAAADDDYFARAIRRYLDASETESIHSLALVTYRWQYVVSGIKDDPFPGVLTELFDEEQSRRVTHALATQM